MTYKLPYASVLLTGPKPVRDQAGELSRNREIQPCGCWKGEVYGDVPLRGADGQPVRDAAGAIQTTKAWIAVRRGCQPHAGAFAVVSLRFAERMTGSLPDHARKFLAEHADRLLAEVVEVDAALIALLGQRPPTILDQLAASAKAAGVALPSHTPAPALPRSDR